MNLKDPYREAVALNFIFTWGDRETEDRAKVSMPPLFRGIVDQYYRSTKHLTGMQCMVIRTRLEIKQQDFRTKRNAGYEIISKLSPL